MPDKPLIQLDHLHIPARKPEWLAEWYAEQFGLNAQGGFLTGPGTLIVFAEGDPVNYEERPHFGFRCQSREAVEDWADKLQVQLDASNNYCGFRARDPEGNHFEVYWEAR